MNLDLDGLGGGIAGSVGNGEGVGSGFFWGEIEAAVVRGPDFAFRRVERDGLGVGDVVAELGFFAAMDGRTGDIESAEAEFGAAELFDGAAVVFAALFKLFFFGALFEIASGLVAGVDGVTNIGGEKEDKCAGVEEGIFERGFYGGFRGGVHFGVPNLKIARNGG